MTVSDTGTDITHQDIILEHTSFIPLSLCHLGLADEGQEHLRRARELLRERRCATFATRRPLERLAQLRRDDFAQRCELRSQVFLAHGCWVR